MVVDNMWALCLIIIIYNFEKQVNDLCIPIFEF